MPLIETSPISAALEAMRRFDYAEAKTVLLDEYDRDTNKFELARIANLIEIGMISEAIEALNTMTGIEAYMAHPPADMPIGKTATGPLIRH